MGCEYGMLKYWWVVLILNNNLIENKRIGFNNDIGNGILRLNFF